MIPLWCMNVQSAHIGKGRDMTNYVVKLNADNGTYPRLIVSADTPENAMKVACNIELAPLRSVVSVTEYEGK